MVWNSRQPNSDPKVLVDHTVIHSTKEWNDAHVLLKLEGMVRQYAASTNLPPLQIKKRLLALPEFKKDMKRLPYTLNMDIRNWTKSVRRKFRVEEIEVVVPDDTVDDDDATVNDAEDKNDQRDSNDLVWCT